MSPMHVKGTSHHYGMNIGGSQAATFYLALSLKYLDDAQRNLKARENIEVRRNMMVDTSFSVVCSAVTPINEIRGSTGVTETFRYISELIDKFRKSLKETYDRQETKGVHVDETV